MASPALLVRRQQQRWALRCGIAFDGSGYTADLSDNLFAPLCEASRAEFADADGGELGRPGERAKMQALHSSSALACNVFEYWRERDATPLARCFGVDGPAQIEFERKYPTGLPGNAPNLDVVLRPSSGPLLAIESKFLEPYGRHVHGLKDKYFEPSPGRWARSGYSHCQELARALRSEPRFRWLHAEQLLKHVLGLTAREESWRLLYLWYEVAGPAGAEHRAECEQFARVVAGDGIDFAALSYQSLFADLCARVGQRDTAYTHYLGERYFERSDWQADRAVCKLGS